MSICKSMEPSAPVADHPRYLRWDPPEKTKMIQMGPWRPWNHNEYNSTYRAVMRTLMVLAKVPGE